MTPSGGLADSARHVLKRVFPDKTQKHDSGLTARQFFTTLINVNIIRMVAKTSQQIFRNGRLTPDEEEELNTPDE